MYLVATITINDREGYKRYEDGFVEVFRQFKGRALAVSEEPEVLEGQWACTRTVLLEFPDRDEAMAWYHSPGYQAIIGHRQTASTGDVILMDGYGP